MPSFMRMLALLLCQSLLSWMPALAGAVVINEIRIDQPGADRDEYFELAGPPGAALDGLSYVVIGDGRGGSGVVEAVIDLDGRRLSATGFFLVAEPRFSLSGAVDLRTGLNFENGDNVTHLLVRDFSAALQADLDRDDDGVLDRRAWSAVLDGVALIAQAPGGERVYSGVRVGPVDGAVPRHVFRDPDGHGPWRAARAWGEDTPGGPRPAAPPAAVTVAEPSVAWLLGWGVVLLCCGRRRCSGGARVQHGAGGGDGAAALHGGLQAAQHVVQGVQA